MEATFKHHGDEIDYTPSGAVALGQVVVYGDNVGVAKRAIAANELGSLAIEGVFEVPKSTAGSSAIGIGKLVYWDDAANVITTTAGSLKKMGYTVTASVDADATQLVKLARA